MNFTTQELKCFLFKKKICPNCKNKMKRIVKKNYVGMEATPMSAPLKMYEYKNYYYCNVCDKEISLSELAKMES